MLRTSVTSTPSAAPAPYNTDFQVEPGPSGTVVRAKFKLMDSDIGDEGTRYDAQQQTAEILKYARTTYPEANEVDVTGTILKVTAYGDPWRMTVLDVSYTRATLAKINFDGMGTDPESIWKISDSSTINPRLRN